MIKGISKNRETVIFRFPAVEFLTDSPSLYSEEDRGDEVLGSVGMWGRRVSWMSGAKEAAVVMSFWVTETTHTSLGRTLSEKGLLEGFWGDEGSQDVWKGQGLGLEIKPSPLPMHPPFPSACLLGPLAPSACKSSPRDRERGTGVQSQRGMSPFLLVPVRMNCREVM